MGRNVSHRWMSRWWTLGGSVGPLKARSYEDANHMLGWGFTDLCRVTLRGKTTFRWKGPPEDLVASSFGLVVTSPSHFALCNHVSDTPFCEVFRVACDEFRYSCDFNSLFCPSYLTCLGILDPEVFPCASTGFSPSPSLPWYVTFVRPTINSHG